MSKIVTPMDVALAGLKIWRVQMQTATLAAMDMTEMTHGLMVPLRRTGRPADRARGDRAPAAGPQVAGSRTGRPRRTGACRL